MSIAEIAAAAKAASIRLAAATTEQKDAALAEIAGAIRAASEQLIAANSADLAAAGRHDNCDYQDMRRCPGPWMISTPISTKKNCSRSRTATAAFATARDADTN